MGRKMKDEELRAYQERIGTKLYREIYLYEANKVRRLTKHNTRYSKKHYINSKEKLNAIKEKYKNGITTEILTEFMKNM
jgi:hypothetical protein